MAFYRSPLSVHFLRSLLDSPKPNVSLVCRKEKEKKTQDPVPLKRTFSPSVGEPSPDNSWLVSFIANIGRVPTTCRFGCSTRDPFHTLLPWVITVSPSLVIHALVDPALALASCTWNIAHHRGTRVLVRYIAPVRVTPCAIAPFLSDELQFALC